MRKLLTLEASVLLAFSFAGIAYAGQINFSAIAFVNFSSGSFANFGSTALPTIYGYSTHPSGTCGANAAYYQKLLAAGATEQRTDDVWKQISPTSTSETWTTLDCPVNDALALGIQTTLIIYSAPTWAALGGCVVNGSNHCSPANPLDYQQFAYDSALHFLGKVHSYECWNEPNNVTFWQPSASTTQYAADLNACYRGVKAADPTATVLYGGLAPESTSGGSISITDFLTGTYASGTTTLFDILAAHPYTFPQNLDQSSGDATNNGWKAMLAEEGIMAANGDGAKKIWITEFGAPTCGRGNAKGLGFIAFGASDYLTLQAQQILAQEATNAVAGSSTITNFFWYTLIDSNSLNPSTRENCFGTYYSYGIPKPLYAQLRSN